MKRLLMVVLFAWMSSAVAEFTIPQDVLDVVGQDGSVKIMVRLDVPFIPEGDLSAAEIVAQRSLIADAQDSFETELEIALSNMDVDLDDATINDNSSNVDITVRKFASVPLVAMEVDGQTLLAMKQDGSIKNIHLNEADFASLGRIGADLVHQQGYHGSGQVIGLLDSGEQILAPKESLWIVWGTL